MGRIHHRIQNQKIVSFLDSLRRAVSQQHTLSPDVAPDLNVVKAPNDNVRCIPVLLQLGAEFVNRPVSLIISLHGRVYRKSRTIDCIRASDEEALCTHIFTLGATSCINQKRIHVVDIGHARDLARAFMASDPTIADLKVIICYRTTIFTQWHVDALVNISVSYICCAEG